MIKRVVAVGGDLVEISDGKLKVNGITVAPASAASNSRLRTVPDGSLFVLGDHLHVSRDSRDFGLVAVRNVAARVILVWWPPSRFGAVSSLPVLSDPTRA